MPLKSYKICSKIFEHGFDPPPFWTMLKKTTDLGDDATPYFCIMGDSGISEESGAFSDYTQSHRSGDFGSSGVGCEEYRFSTPSF